MRPTSSLRQLSLVLLYLGFLFIAAHVPLRLEEILQLAAFQPHAQVSLIHWIAGTPGAAPLNYFTEWPIIQLFGNGLFAARAVSIVCALLCGVLVWVIGRRIELQYPLVAAVIFALMPAQYHAAAMAIPSEQGLLCVLAATVFFIDLTRTPKASTAILYSLGLTLAIYTQTAAVAPACGFLFFYLRFVGRPAERRVFWYLLPATVIPLLLYVPYYVWATPQVTQRWLFAPVPGDTPLQQTLYAVGGYSIWGTLACLVLLVGSVYAVWPALVVTEMSTPLQKNVVRFSLLGGVVSVFVVAVLGPQITSSSVRLAEVLPALPFLALLFVAGMELSMRLPARRLATILISGLAVTALSLAGDFEYLRKARQVDMQSLANTVHDQMTGDACVVFVSEGFSRSIFSVLLPDLESKECREFFHSRIVLAIHPYVRMDQQRDAQTFFHGLGFRDTKRVSIGGGEIVVLTDSRQ